jgi:hypothetical protein
MFQSNTYAASNTRSLRDTLRRALAPAPPTPEALELDSIARIGGVAHQHRAPLGWRRERRPGGVALRPQPCLTPLPRARHRRA